MIEKFKKKMDDFLSNTKNRKNVLALSAIMFTLFTLYQIYICKHLETSRIGRIIGVVIFILLTASSYFALIPKPQFTFMRMVFLILGLGANFIVKLLNAEYYFHYLSITSFPSILNCAVFLLSELAVFILFFYYLVIRHKPFFLSEMKEETEKKLTKYLMYTSIALYGVCFLFEMILLVFFHTNVDLNVASTAISRIFYLLGFVSLALSFMFPTPKIELDEDDDEEEAPPISVEVDNDLVIY